MNYNDEKLPVMEYLLWTFLLVGISYIIVIPAMNLEIAKGPVKIIFILIDCFIGTFSPMHATYIVLKRRKRVENYKAFLKSVFHMNNVIKSILYSAIFCCLILITAVCIGKRTTNSIIFFPLFIPIAILAGGVEEVGWRGFLQVQLEKRMPYLYAVLITSTIWLIWHLPLWLIKGSTQSTLEIAPYFLNLLVDSFILSTIYTMTKSVFPCILYHAWGNSIGVLYEWDVFATTPLRTGLIVYYVVALCIVLIIRTIQKHAISVS